MLITLEFAYVYPRHTSVRTMLHASLISREDRGYVSSCGGILILITPFPTIQIGAWMPWVEVLIRSDFRILCSAVLVNTFLGSHHKAAPIGLPGD